MWHHDAVQLISIALYHDDGRRREVGFNPGRLNVVTGFSKTGKSALLDIVDFCLGRDSHSIPRTRAFRYVAWYATLWEFTDGSRALLARPRAKAGKASTTQAMLQFGGKELNFPSFDNLWANTDSDSLRDQIDAHLGTGGARISPPEGSLRSPYKVGLGQASVFLFQAQNEIANRSQLFHRQEEDRMRDSIKDSLPFFLGAMKGDHAEKHQQLRLARRQLRRAETALEAAEAEASENDSHLQGLLAEAHAAGLTDVKQTTSASNAIAVLQGILGTIPATDLSVDLQAQDRHHALRTELLQLRAELGQLLDDRSALLESSTTEGSYESAIAQQLQRLSSVGLLPQDTHDRGDVCPVCNQGMADADPVASQLSARLEELSGELELLATVQPGREKALSDLSAQIQTSRERLAGVEMAYAAASLTQEQQGVLHSAEKQQFVRGRIDATVGRLALRTNVDVATLRSSVQVAASRVRALESELDDDAARERLTSALIALGRDMTEFAQHLRLENADERVRLDLSKLTVVTDSADGPVPLSALGSGANWLGYHLATHLALHKSFITNGAPVPRLLMLDQPTQVFYESRSKDEQQQIKETGNPAEEDHESVTRMFKLLYDFVASYAPGIQIIVSDHVNLTDEAWFQESIIHNWRGEALVPADWVAKS